MENTIQQEAEAYLILIVSPLIENRDLFEVETKEDEKGILLSVSLEKPDMGRVIGKNGETIRSIKRLVRQFGFVNGNHISVLLKEPQQ